jgi:hypothetical protein
MCRCRTSLIRGTKKGHGKISWPNPIGKHIQVLQQNPSDTGLECGQPWRPFRAKKTYSITSSASARSVGGMARPSALAVLRLITSSNVTGCMTGRSIVLAPLRTRLA